MTDVGYLQRHYETLVTEELLRLRSSPLTDEAMSVLETELASRLTDVDAAEKTYLDDRAQHQVHESHLASIGARLLAKIIDCVGAFAVLGVLNFECYTYYPLNVSEAFGYISLFALFIYLFFKDAMDGQSIGKRMLRIRVVHTSTGEPCTLPQSLVRNFLCAFGIVDAAFALGSKRQRLGDLAAGTSVVRVQAGKRS
jgi:uncharacterized RDD family membrane protein YckC